MYISEFSLETNYLLKKEKKILKLQNYVIRSLSVLLDFSLTVKAASHACVIRIGQP